MRLNVFKSKIHRATVTHADLEYEGSVTVDSDLLDAAEILPYEAVHIWNVTRGSRLMTYALPGPRGSGAICVNGAAAHLNKPGDMVILATFAEMTREEARNHRGLQARRHDREGGARGLSRVPPNRGRPQLGAAHLHRRWHAASEDVTHAEGRVRNDPTFRMYKPYLLW